MPSRHVPRTTLELRLHREHLGLTFWRASNWLDLLRLSTLARLKGLHCGEAGGVQTNGRPRECWVIGVRTMGRNWIESYMQPLSCDQVYFTPSRRIIERVEQELQPASGRILTLLSCISAYYLFITNYTTSRMKRYTVMAFGVGNICSDTNKDTLHDQRGMRNSPPFFHLRFPSKST